MREGNEARKAYVTSIRNYGTVGQCKSRREANMKYQDRIFFYYYLLSLVLFDVFNLTIAEKYQLSEINGIVAALFRRVLGREGNGVEVDLE